LNIKLRLLHGDFMRYLSIDLEATGLGENDYIIEFGMVPFDTETRKIEEHLARNYFIKCPSFESLRPKLDPWVIEHNEKLIRKAHAEGLTMDSFREELATYLGLKEVKDYFSNEKKEKIILFGKSMNAIDLPFLTRDLGWSFMRKHFHHRDLDLSSTANTMIDLGFLPPQCSSGSGLMRHLGLGEVCHTALEDARNTAKMYLKILELHSK
jgi:oligoribonuclease (3'-5' exoribonuclease)